MTESGFVISARPLVSAADWEAWRADVEALEADALASPWASWRYWETCARLLDHRGCWALDVRETPGAPLLAAAVLREEALRRGGLSLRGLRAFDQVSFMRVPSYLARRGREEDVASAVETAIRRAAELARADLVTLYRQDAATARPLALALARRGTRVRGGTWTRAAQMLLPDELAGHLRERHPGLERGIERSRRRVVRDRRAEPRVLSYAAATLDEVAWEALRARLDALERETWQHAWEARSGRVDLERSRAFDDACRELWRQKGWLHVHLLVLPDDAGGEADAAFALTLDVTDRAWFVSSGFDPAFREFSPGRMLLLDAVRAGHERGVRVFELGGEVLGWKTQWANRYEDVRRLEWGQPTWKGRLWSLFQRVTGSSPAPVGGVPDVPSSEP